MAKRLQIYLPDECWQVVEGQLKEANENFVTGSISYSDLVCEMILTSRVDIKSLQLKRTDLRKSLKVLAAQPDIDLDTVIKHLSEMKPKMNKKSGRGFGEQESLV